MLELPLPSHVLGHLAFAVTGRGLHEHPLLSSVLVDCTVLGFGGVRSEKRE